jgi:hypothetical protein
MSSPTGVNHDDMIQDALLLTSLKGDESSPKKARKHSSTDELVDIRESLKSEEQDEKIIDLTTLPDPKVDCNPDDYLRQLVHSLYNIEPKVKKAIDLGDYFPEITDEQVAAYDILVVSACRENDVDRLKALHAEKCMSVSCCNRFGESLLHMACRRGFREDNFCWKKPMSPFVFVTIVVELHYMTSVGTHNRKLKWQRLLFEKIHRCS